MSQPEPSRPREADASPDPDTDTRGTKERLLDAAQRLFGERGFEGTSLRAVTQAAGTSVSAANYHFGSKEELLRSVLLRVVEPMNALRLERLTAAERTAGDARLSLEVILGAYLDPLFEHRASGEGGSRDARFLAARLYSDPPELVSALKRELFGELSRRFLDALGRALPDCPAEDLRVRFQLAVGAMVHVMSGQLEDAPHLHAGGVPSDAVVRDHLLAFLAAGLRAPAETRR